MAVTALGLLIQLVLVGLILWAVYLKSRRRKDGDVVKNAWQAYLNLGQNTQAYRQQVRRQVQQAYGRQSQPKPNARQAQQAYGRQSQPKPNRQPMENQAARQAYGQLSRSVQADTRNAEAEESVLMDQVYDLLVTGYSGNLKFDRDFLAEGMDMLNRIQG